MNNKRLVVLTLCCILAVVLGSPVLSIADNASETNAKAEQYLEKANELRKLADHQAAIAEYAKVISLSPNSDIAQNAQYWIGQSHFEAKQFDAAHSVFQELVDKYPTSSIVSSTKQMIERVEQAKRNLALFEAVKKADVEHVKLLIAEGAGVDAKWGDITIKEDEKKSKQTPLCYAVDINNIDLVKILVEAGADVNAGPWSPPLVKAVGKNNMAMAEYLIDHGADLNSPPDWGSLLQAVHVGNIEMMKLLLKKGADVNATEYTTPLLEAVTRHRQVDKEIVKLLLEHGANVDNKASWEEPPLGWAISLNDPYFRNILLAHGANVETKNPLGETYLQSVARSGRTESIQWLLEAGANFNAMSDNGQTALHIILDINSVNYERSKLSKDTLELLLSKGADVELKDKDGRTPLHLASESADEDVVELLLDKGAKINEKENESGLTALHHAARIGKRNVAELLIAKGADINVKDKQGRTPLYFAANHDSRLAEYLMKNGADSSIRIDSSQTLLQLAQQRKKRESAVPDMIFNGKPDSLFGNPIACGDVDGDGHDDILIGAILEDGSRGQVYLFYGGPNMDTTADLILEGQNKGDKFGSGIVCGDIDNDGYSDIIVTASSYGNNRGRAYLFWGSDRSSMDANPDKILGDESKAGSFFGFGSPAVCDIDNDGYDDIILGTRRSQDDKKPRVFLYYGNTKEFMDTSHDLAFTADMPGRQPFFAYQLACGDINKDGYGDIVIGFYLWPKNVQQCRAYLYYGDKRSDLNEKVDVVFEMKSVGDFSPGRCIACVDQNRDGYDDILFCASGHNAKQGRAYLFHGNSKQNLDTGPDMIFDGEARGSSYGRNTVCGDIDGDNVNDLMIGACDFGGGSGRVYVYWGSEITDSNPKPGWILTGENSKDFFGQGFACGDVNNDGCDDLVIGAYGYKDKAGTKQGRAYLYYGGPKSP
ncbi:ankyrin repeat domain-containing protein [Planctomycetota bacterium]